MTKFRDERSEQMYAGFSEVRVDNRVRVQAEPIHIDDQSLLKIYILYPDIRILVDLCIFNQYELSFNYHLREAEKYNSEKLKRLSLYLVSLFINVWELRSKEGEIISYHVSDLRRYVQKLSSIVFYCDGNVFNKLYDIEKTLINVLPTRFYYKPCVKTAAMRTVCDDEKSNLISYLLHQFKHEGVAKLPLQGYEPDQMLMVIQRLDLDLYFNEIQTLFDKESNLSMALFLKKRKDRKSVV